MKDVCMDTDLCYLFKNRSIGIDAYKKFPYYHNDDYQLKKDKEKFKIKTRWKVKRESE